MSPTATLALLFQSLELHNDPMFLTVFVILSYARLRNPAASISIGSVLLTVLVSAACAQLSRTIPLETLFQPPPIPHTPIPPTSPPTSPPTPIPTTTTTAPDATTTAATGNVNHSDEAHRDSIHTDFQELLRFIMNKFL